MSTTLKSVKFSSKLPRRNLPRVTSAKRGESNFVCAFERSFSAFQKGYGVMGREFPVSGFGIADFVWIQQPKPLSLSDVINSQNRDLKGSLDDIKITAFEMKIHDWRGALTQAYRYTYFADQTVVVLPQEKAERVLSALSLFKKLQVGLWGFEIKEEKIQEIFTPALSKPKSLNARFNALKLLRQNLSGFRK